MSWKFSDLAEQIYDDTKIPTMLGVAETLIWLDEHPDQVPGRTVTRRDFERAFDFHFDDEDIDRHERFLAHLGITVVPDPEPTNAEKIDRLLLEHELIADAKYRKVIAEALDSEGVRAPEADEIEEES